MDLHIRERDGLLGKVFSVFEYVFKLSKLKRDLDVDCTISFLERSNIANVVSEMISLRFRKTVVSVRNNLSLQYKKFGLLFRSIVRVAISVFYFFAGKVVCLSEGVRSDIQQYLLFGGNSVTIYNGYDFEKIKSLALVRDDGLMKWQNSVSGCSCNFIFVGRLSEQKGLGIFLRAFAIAAEKYQHISLSVFGDGEDRDQIMSEIESLGLTGKVFIHEPVENVFSYVASADVFVFPSKWEGFGNALAEAISLGKFVLAADCKYGPREMLGVSRDLNDSKFSVTKNGILYSNPVEDDDPVSTCFLALDECIRLIQEGRVQICPVALSDFRRRFSVQSARKDWISLLT